MLCLMRPGGKKKRRPVPRGKNSGIKNETLIPAKEVISRAWELAEPLCAAEALDLIHIEYQREPAGWVLRVYIEKPGGVTIDDCTAVSRQLGDLLDIKFDSQIAYILEVSSPGPKRPVSRLSDFDKLKGETARIRTGCAICGRKNFTGELMGTLDDMVLLKLDCETIFIPHREISKARLVNKYGDNKC